jgi:hypothetical protein
MLRGMKSLITKDGKRVAGDNAILDDIRDMLKELED